MSECQKGPTAGFLTSLHEKKKKSMDSWAYDSPALHLRTLSANVTFNPTEIQISAS